MSDKQDNKDLTSDEKHLDAIQRAIQALDLQRKAKQPVDRKFWKTQPVVQDDYNQEPGPIEEPDMAAVPLKPYPLPKGFVWSTVDVMDDKELDEIYTLLYNSYVEDDNCRFRFHYSRAFLRWALTPPGYQKDWHIAIRRVIPGQDHQPIAALITALPMELRVSGREVHGSEVNFLCVVQALRSKRVAPILIKEVTRRIHLQDIWFSTYTVGDVVTRPLSHATYWHRSLNPKKLIDVGFSGKPRDMTLDQVKVKYALPLKPTLSCLRPMEKKDLASALALFKNYHQERQCQLYHDMNVEEFGHFLLTRKDVVYSYCLNDPATGDVTDFLSFYVIPSTVFGNPDHNELRVVYSYYNATSTVGFHDLILNSLILAKSVAKGDVFNMLDIMDNNTAFEQNKFSIGDGTLNYYVYNWQCPPFDSNKLGLVLM